MLTRYWSFLTVFGLFCCVFGLILTHGMPGRPSTDQGPSPTHNIDAGFVTVSEAEELAALQKSLQDEVLKVTNEENINKLMYGMLEFKIGNNSINSLKAALLDSASKLSKGCVADLIRAVENMASTSLYATSCKLDYPGDPDALAACFDNNTIPIQWAAQLFDSWGKVSSGIMSSGPFFYMGEFDQCLSISIPADPKLAHPDNETFSNAQYCRLDVQAQDPIRQRRAPLFYGICAPLTCQEDDMKEFLNFWTNGLFMDLVDLTDNSSVAVQCYQKHEIFVWSNGDIAYVLIMSLLFAAVVSGTIVDICSQRFKYRFNKNPRQVAGFDCSVSSFTTLSYSNDGQMAKYLTVEEYFKDIDNLDEKPRHKSGKCGSYRQNLISIMEDELSVGQAPSVALTYKGGEDLMETFRKSSFLMDIITAFSIRKSVEHLLRESGSQIKCLHGLKVLSAVWVIIGHTFLMSIGYVGNPKTLIVQIKHWWLSHWILNSSLAVDSFFFMAGAVLAFSFRRRLISAQNDKSRLHRLFQMTRWLVVFFHRFLRLIPSYVVVLGFTSTILNKLGSGPMWDKQNGVFGTKCTSTSWWQHLLFVLNFFPTECMPWMWYISLDMQFYLVAPLCLYLLHKVSAFGKAIIGLFILSSSVYRVVIFALYSFPSNIVLRMIEKESVVNEEAAQMYGLLYAAPQARMAPFYIGILIGWILAVKKKFKRPNPLKKNYMDSALVRMALRVGALLLLAWSLYGSQFEAKNWWYGVVYSSQYRITWSLGLGLLVWLCERGHFEPLSSILGWSKWVPLSRLCFGIYLSHELLIIMTVYQRRRVWMVEGPTEVVTYALGIAVLSIICAFVLAVFVELPPLILERKLFMRTRRNIRVKKEDDGHLTVFEQPNVYRLKKFKKNKKKKHLSISDNSVSGLNAYTMGNSRQMPAMRPTAKVLDWLSHNEDKSEGDAAVKTTRSRQSGNAPQDTLSITSNEASASQKLDKLYPWDNPEWVSDTRMGQGQNTLQGTDSTQKTHQTQTATASHVDVGKAEKAKRRSRSQESKLYGSFDV